MKTTLDLNSVLIIKNQKLIQIKMLIDNNNIFSKIYPAPKTILESCAPLISFCSEDTDEISNLLDKSGVDYYIKHLEKDIIQELLKN